MCIIFCRIFLIMITKFKIFEKNSESKYYRAIEKNIGDDVIFNIKNGGYYEAIGEDEEPKFMFGEYLESDILEIAASKYVGGCVMGLFSMSRARNYYIYEINEKPDVDISHWSGGDFEFLEEVRYRRSIKAKYVGEVILNEDVYFMLESYYMLYNNDIENDDLELKRDRLRIVDMIESTEFNKILKKY